jgi:phosphate starvation-inducible protein PhoH
MSQTAFDVTEEDYRPTRKERKMSRKALRGKSNNVVHLHQQNPLQLEYIKPKTENQRKTFREYSTGKNLLLHGVPGSGKTFISLYLALDELMNQNSKLQKVVIIRSAQSSKGIGFLPGTAKQKMEVYETPYSSICSKLFERSDAYQLLKNKGIIEFESTSFLRGTTIDDAIIIIDEAQNLSYQELKTVLTRVGDNSKIVICGDVNQDDLTSARYNEESGLKSIMKIMDKIPSVSKVEFEIQDIVRSGFVKEFIIAELNLA